MLSILLLILKIVGSIIGIILGIIIIIALVILFVPIRYQGAVRYVDCKDSLKCKIRLSWLLHLIQGDLYYKDSALKWRFRAAWIKKVGGQEVKKDEEVSQETMEKAEETVSEESVARTLEEEKYETQKGTEMETEYEGSEKTGPDIEEESQAVDDLYFEDRSVYDEMFQDDEFFHGDEMFHEDSDDSGDLVRTYKEASDTKETIYTRVSHFFEKIRDFIDKLKCTFRSFCDRINKISNKVELYNDFIHDDVHRKAFVRAKKAAVPFLRSLFKGSVSGNMVFGFEDPYHTGQALAGAAVIFPFIGEDIHVEPDFEKQTLRASLKLKGKWSLCHLLSLFLKLILSGSVRRTYKDIRRIIEGEEQ